MEYTFISKETFETLLNNYLSRLPECKQDKALINLDLLGKIKAVLLDPKNFHICDKNTRNWAMKRFCLEEVVPGDFRVLVKADNKPVLVVENMYEILCRTHAEIDQHGGQKQLWKSIKERWSWVKQDLVEKFVNNCNICAIRKPSFHPLAAKPIIARNFLSRIQIDLIDLSYDPDGEYKYICHIRDHFTRFSWAKALTSKRAVEVAAYLFDLFHFLGSPPKILQSDNGKEFTATIIKELISLWPTVKIINGRPRHPQSQGLVERANGILQQKLGKWKEDTGRNDWSFGLHSVILSMNHSYCRSHKKTPYELVFGDKPHGGCTLIEDLFSKGIYDEENIPETVTIKDFEYSAENLDDDMVDEQVSIPLPAIPASSSSFPAPSLSTLPTPISLPSVPAPSPQIIKDLGEIEERDDDCISIDSVDTVKSAQIQYETYNVNDNEHTPKISQYHPIPIDPVLIDITNTAIRSETTITGHDILREAARKNLQSYTDKMVNQMNKKKRSISYEVGDLVRITIPKIDRSGIDRPTLPCKVLEITKNNQYVLGSKFGIINVHYSPREIEPLGTIDFPELNNLPSNKISVREAAHLQSTGLVTGAICNCKSNCNNNKCRCKKVGQNCGSRCHSGRPCQNKCEN
ncbi:KRAB-A domain-containing protein 2-like [Rhizophagus clarus]|uniref:KRAB-A domain-containing protein 2-like n=1 Tax=Rhizophagus clarus TaxID=94130 RepID=A0A8H3KVX3_9GLOM|nr:KRAB-A domain-containing protein 2-like [Rhizophagus clarus]